MFKNGDVKFTIKSYLNKELKAWTAWICKNVFTDPLSDGLLFAIKHSYTPPPNSVSSFYGIWTYEYLARI